MNVQKSAVRCLPSYDAARCFRMKVCVQFELSHVRTIPSSTYAPPSRRPSEVHSSSGSDQYELSGSNPPQRRMRDRALASGVVGPQHHQRIVTTKILPTLTTSFLCLPPRGKPMITAPVARSPLLFFAGFQSYPLTTTQSPHLTDSAFYASAHPKRSSSFRKFAMRKDAAGACAFPRAGCPRTWSTCSKSSRNSQSNWARRCRR